MAKLDITKGSTDVTQYIFVQDSSVTTGVGLTGLVYNSSGLVAYYVRPLASPAAITLATQTVTGAHADGGFVEVDATNMPGIYRLDLPDAVCASGANSVVVVLKGAANMAPVTLEVQLVSFNPNDATRMGLTALPNAAADTAGGLPISDAGGLDLDNLGADTDTLLTRLSAARAGYLDNINNTALSSLLAPIRTGTAQAGAATTITLDAGASAKDNFYRGALIRITGGTGAGQSPRMITAYTGSTKVATVAAWATNPDNTSTFAILDWGNIRVANAIGTGGITTASFAAGAIDAAAIAEDAIGASELAADAVTEIQNGLATATSLATAQADLDTLTGTDGVTLATSQPNYAPATAAALTTHDGKLDTVDANVDAILTDTADIQPKLGTITDLGGGATVGANLSDMAGATFSTASDSLEAIRDRGDAAWVTGGSGAITQVLNVQPIIPVIDLADTATVRIALMLVNSVDDLPSTAEITPGTISIDRKAIGGTSWSAVVTDAPCSEAAGLIYYDEVFDTATGYAAGDSIRVTFKSQSITADANTYEITGSGGVIWQTYIREAERGTDNAALASGVNVTQISGDATAADNLETMLDGTGGQTLTLGQLRINSSSANGAIDIDNSGGAAIDARGTTAGAYLQGTGALGIGLSAGGQLLGAAFGGTAAGGGGLQITGNGATGLAIVGPNGRSIGLNNGTYNDDIIALINAEADTALSDYAPATATSLATAQTDLDTITGSDGVTLATTQPNYAPATAASVAALNDLSESQVNAQLIDVLTVDQIADSLAANGDLPTFAQAILLILRALSNAKTEGTVLTIYKEDGITPAATFNLNDPVTPTEIKRAT